MPTEPAALRDELIAPAAHDAGRLRHHPAHRPIVVRGERPHRGEDRVAAVGGGHRRGAGDRAVRRADRRSGAGADGRTDHAEPGPERACSGATRREASSRSPARCSTDRPAHGRAPSLRELRRDAGRNRSPDDAHRSRRWSGCASTPATSPTAAATRASCWHATARGCGTCTSRTASRRSPRGPAPTGGIIRPRSATGSSASWVAAASTFPACWAICRATGFDGWIVVEQDVLPAMGAPLASATRNREYLRSIGV